MKVFNKVRFVIYRYNQKGLEIFLINSDLSREQSVWKLPKSNTKKIGDQHNKCIELNTTLDENGDPIRIFAIEGDWHDIPSIRGLIKYDVHVVKEAIKELVPGMDKGAYFVVKEAIKKVLPNEYKALKELKEILADRNMVRNI